MTPKELKVVEKHIRSIFQEWHLCALSPREAKENKLPSGQMCDVCEHSIKFHMKCIREEI